MIRFLTAMVVFGGSAMLAHGTQAASFDCGKAATPFEQAICDNPDLSTADEELAAGYAAAIEGLSAGASETLRKSQHDWLDFARRACTKDALPLESGDYDADGVTCLQSVFSERTDVLATSQMKGGLRFYPISSYDALKDDQASADMPFWVGTNVATAPKIDGDDEIATGFNEMVDDILAKNAAGSSGEPSEDLRLAVKVSAVTPVRIGLGIEFSDYGHGAAHGNYGLSTANYLIAENRALVASDVFTGEDWESKLRTIVVDAVRAQLGDDLQLDDPSTLDDVITDPSRWDFSEAGFIVQFGPYEVSYYAMGAPAVLVPWDELAGIVTDEVEGLKAVE